MSPDSTKLDRVIEEFRELAGPPAGRELQIPEIPRAAHGRTDRPGTVTGESLKDIIARIDRNNAFEGFEEMSIYLEVREQLIRLSQEADQTRRVSPAEREVLEHRIQHIRKHRRIIAHNRERLIQIEALKGTLKKASVDVSIPAPVENSLSEHLTALTKTTRHLIALKQFNMLLWKKKEGKTVPDADWDKTVGLIPEEVEGRLGGSPIRIRLGKEALVKKERDPENALNDSMKRDAETALDQEIEWMLSFKNGVPGVDTRHEGRNPVDVYLATLLTGANEALVNTEIKYSSEIEPGPEQDRKIKAVRDARADFQKQSEAYRTAAGEAHLKDLEEAATGFFDQEFKGKAPSAPDLQQFIAANLPSREDQTRYKDARIQAFRGYKAEIKKIFNTNLWDLEDIPRDIRLRMEDAYKKKGRFKVAYPVLEGMMRLRVAPRVVASKLVPGWLGGQKTFQGEIDETMEQVRTAWKLPKTVKIKGVDVPFDYWDEDHWKAIPADQWAKIEKSQESTLDILRKHEQAVNERLDRYDGDLNTYDELWKTMHPADLIGTQLDIPLAERLMKKETTIAEVLAGKPTKEQLLSCWLIQISTMRIDFTAILHELGIFEVEGISQMEDDMETGKQIANAKPGFPWEIVGLIIWLAWGFVRSPAGGLLRIPMSLGGPVWDVFRLLRAVASRAGGAGRAGGLLVAVGATLHLRNDIYAYADAIGYKERMQENLHSEITNMGFKYDARNNCFVRVNDDGTKTVIRIDKDFLDKLPDKKTLMEGKIAADATLAAAAASSLLMGATAATGVGLLVAAGIVTVEVIYTKKEREPQFKFVRESEPYMLAYVKPSEDFNPLRLLYCSVGEILVSKEYTNDWDGDLSTESAKEIRRRLLFMIYMNELKKDKKLLVQTMGADFSPQAINRFYYGDFRNFVLPVMLGKIFTQIEDLDRNNTDFTKTIPWEVVRKMQFQKGAYAAVPHVQPEHVMDSAYAMSIYTAQSKAEEQYFEIVQEIRRLCNAGKYTEAAELDVQARELGAVRVLGTTLYHAHDEIVENAGARFAFWKNMHPEYIDSGPRPYISRARVMAELWLHRMNTEASKKTLRYVEEHEGIFKIDDAALRSTAHGPSVGPSRAPYAYPPLISFQRLVHSGHTQSQYVPDDQWSRTGATGSVARRVYRGLEDSLHVDRHLLAARFENAAAVRFSYTDGRNETYVLHTRKEGQEEPTTYYLRQTKDGWEYKSGIKMQELDQADWKTIDFANIARFLSGRDGGVTPKTPAKVKEVANMTDIIALPIVEPGNEEISVSRITKSYLPTGPKEKEKNEKFTDVCTRMYRQVAPDDFASRGRYLHDLLTGITEFEKVNRKNVAYSMYVNANARGLYGSQARQLIPKAVTEEEITALAA